MLKNMKLAVVYALVEGCDNVQYLNKYRDSGYVWSNSYEILTETYETLVDVVNDIDLDSLSGNLITYEGTVKIVVKELSSVFESERACSISRTINL